KASRTGTSPAPFTRWWRSPIVICSRPALRTSTTSCVSRTCTGAKAPARHESLREDPMKVIIPLAGKGTRLRPHTHVTPKPMLRVAGKPVMQYIIDDLRHLGGIDEVVYITGHLKEKVEEYARKALPIKSVFIEQKVQDGTAGAVAL